VGAREGGQLKKGERGGRRGERDKSLQGGARETDEMLLLLLLIAD